MRLLRARAAPGNHLVATQPRTARPLAVEAGGDQQQLGMASG